VRPKREYSHAKEKFKGDVISNDDEGRGAGD